MSDKEKDKLFGELAVDLGFLTKEDVASALSEQKIDEAIGVDKPIGAYFFASGKLDKEQISKIVVIQDKMLGNLQPAANSILSPSDKPADSAQKSIPPVNAMQHPSYFKYTALGLILWPVGLLVGISLIMKPDPLEHKLGEHTIAISIAGALVALLAF